MADNYPVSQVLNRDYKFYLMKYGEQYPLSQELASLKTLGTVGEPINPAAWHWYYEVIGKSRCHVPMATVETFNPDFPTLTYFIK